MPTDTEGRGAVRGLLAAAIALPLAITAAVLACISFEDADATFARVALTAALAFVAVGAGVTLLGEALLLAAEWAAQRRAVRRRLRELRQGHRPVLRPLTPEERIGRSVRSGRWR